VLDVVIISYKYFSVELFQPVSYGCIKGFFMPSFCNAKLKGQLIRIIHNCKLCCCVPRKI